MLRIRSKQAAWPAICKRLLRTWRPNKCSSEAKRPWMSDDMLALLDRRMARISYNLQLENKGPLKSKRLSVEIVTVGWNSCCRQAIRKKRKLRKSSRRKHSRLRRRLPLGRFVEGLKRESLYNRDSFGINATASDVSLRRRLA